MTEKEILKFWKENKIFEKSLQKDGGDFVFYDGPPFATGLPHYGHILTSIIKDVIPRYQTMRGKRVPRKWGWDCHGLPIENLIEKDLHLHSKKDIEKYGVEKFNKKAEESVLQYADEWEKIIPRIGRWVDMERDYKTMDRDYTESVWWVFKSLYDKRLIYEGYKPMHICPRCETTLSNFEVTQNYQEIKDLGVIVKFELIDEPNTYVLAWTTTAWTLPGNVALAINPKVIYCKVKIQKSNLKNDEFYILAKERLEIIKDNYEIIEEIDGKKLVGKKYKPLFPYYSENDFKIYGADFVSIEEGTGIVHIAPAFGEEDMELGKKEKLPFIQHVDMEGKFKPEVKDFAGLKVKPKGNPRETDEKIADFLGKENKLFAKELVPHSYPFCWRCETPLLNYAANSWFVNVVKIKDKLLKNNKKINWVPKHLQEGRFGKWLEGARDWAISRSRYWGAPLPVWRCEKCKEIKVAGSIDEIRNEINGINKIFLVRHGDSENNERRIMNSLPEKEKFHLAESGREQIKRLADKLKGEKIDAIFSSPLLRTKETSEIIAKKLGIEVIFDEKIRELDLGEMNGRSANDLVVIHPTRQSRAKETKMGVESGEHLRTRLENFLAEINKNYKNKNIIVVSHGDPIQMFFGITNGKEIEEIYQDDWYPKRGSSTITYSRPIDLHRPYIDKIEFNCSCGEKMRRVPEVFDCWFESGAMPYAQVHYPFENKENFEANFPAEFIAEGVDQTRGWFYTLLVLSTALFDKPAYKNVVANGIILAEDGQKMSKRLNNYPDPMDVVEKYGADSLRYYLLSSPAVRAESLNFSGKGVDEVHKKVIMRLKNVLNFYEMYAGHLMSLDIKCPSSENILDKWILAKLNVLTNEITEALDNYELDKATRPIADFVDDLSTWYIRRSRNRFKEEGEDKNNAVSTTHFVLVEFSKIIAPFMPFVAEEIYQELKGGRESVHLEEWPKGEKLTKEEQNILENMGDARKIVSIALEERSKHGVKVRQVLESFATTYDIGDDFVQIARDEINVKEIKTGQKENKLDVKITEGLKQEGMARELMRNIQDLRKKVGLMPQGKIGLIIETDKNGEEIIKKFESEIKKGTNTTSIEFSENNGEELKIDELKFKIEIKK